MFLRLNDLGTHKRQPAPAASRSTRRGRLPITVAFAVVLATTGLSVALVTAQSANAATQVNLGTADQFAVLAGAGVTNTSTTTITTQDASVRGDVGTYPNNTVTGEAGANSINFVPPSVGTVRKADAVAQQAQADNLIAYNSAAGAAKTGDLSGQLSGLTLTTGVYKESSALNLASGSTVTFNAQNDPNAVFIIQVASSLTIESGTTVALINGALPCHIFWQVGADVSIGTSAQFKGTVLAKNAITAGSGATIIGRLLAQVASVTLNNNSFVVPTCAPVVTTEPSSTGTSPTPTQTSPTPTQTTPTPTETTPTPTETTPTPTETTPTPTTTIQGGGGGGGGDTGEGNGNGDNDNGNGNGHHHDSGGSRNDTGNSGSSDYFYDSTLPDTGGPRIGLLPLGLAALLIGTTAIYFGKRRLTGLRRG